MSQALNAQGYFQKPNSFDAFVEMFKRIVFYWDSAVSADEMTGVLEAI